jgi:hypothetical protein
MDKVIHINCTVNLLKEIYVERGMGVPLYKLPLEEDCSSEKGKYDNNNVTKRDVKS